MADTRSQERSQRPAHSVVNRLMLRKYHLGPGGRGASWRCCRLSSLHWWVVLKKERDRWRSHGAIGGIQIGRASLRPGATTRTGRAVLGRDLARARVRVGRPRRKNKKNKIETQTEKGDRVGGDEEGTRRSNGVSRFLRFGWRWRWRGAKKSRPSRTSFLAAMTGGWCAASGHG